MRSHATPYRSLSLRGHRVRDSGPARADPSLSLLEVSSVARRGVPDPRHDQRVAVPMGQGRGAAEPLPLLRVRREALLLGVRVEPHQHLRQRSREDRHPARRPRPGAGQRTRGTLLRRVEGALVHDHRRAAGIRHLARLPCQGARDQRRYLMLTRQGTAPPYTTLRPIKGLTARFPVYEDLVEQLRAIPRGSYHEVAAHVCSVAAGWAYSDEDTLATIVARLGLASNRWSQMSVYNDAMFIASTAFLLQST